MSYLSLLEVIFLSSLIVDLFYCHIIYHYPVKLCKTLVFVFCILMFMDFTGVGLKLWSFTGNGLQGTYFLSLPIEEYLFMVIAPYGAIVVWESFHKFSRS